MTAGAPRLLHCAKLMPFEEVMRCRLELLPLASQHNFLAENAGLITVDKG